MDYRYATEGKGSPKREFRSSRSRSHRNPKNNLLETIAQANGGGSVVSQTGEDGVVRLKLLVRKQDLKQMLELVRSGNNNNYNNNSGNFCSLSLEQRLNLLRRKQVSRAKESQQRSWIPELQSIPEEL